MSDDLDDFYKISDEMHVPLGPTLGLIHEAYKWPIQMLLSVISSIWPLGKKGKVLIITHSVTYHAMHMCSWCVPQPK